MVEDRNLGRVVGDRYRLLESIGTGATSSVYRAIHLQTHRSLAVKLLDPTARHTIETLHRFRQEAELLARLAHDHIVEVVEATSLGEDCYLVMPLLAGESLAALLKRETRLPWPRACALLLQLCDAVDHAHRHGIIHRDLKPANCFLVTSSEGCDDLRVLDFGVAKLLNPTGAPLTADGIVVGSPRYFAPEQVESSEVDCRTDVYAAGALLFHMLTGRPPFTEDGPELVIRLTSEVAPTVASVAPGLDIPQHVEAVLARALTRRPRDRFDSMQALAGALRGRRQATPNSSGLLPWTFWVSLTFLKVLVIWTGIFCS